MFGNSLLVATRLALLLTVLGHVTLLTITMKGCFGAVKVGDFYWFETSP
ncbi:MAG: hypothetical protein JNN26_07675 [Candidatus Obscuribacter sp.]|nr:hypothetical protein [Candidatus Obscuribacter sp.]